MSVTGKSEYHSHRGINALRGTSYSYASVYLALLHDLPETRTDDISTLEIGGAWYGRLLLIIDPPSACATSNTQRLLFNEIAGADAGYIKGLAICDAPTGGHWLVALAADQPEIFWKVKSQYKVEPGDLDYTDL